MRESEERTAFAALHGGPRALLASLRKLPAERQAAKVAALAELHPWPVAAALVEIAKSAACDLDERRRMAEHARAAAAEVPEGGGTAEALASLQLEIHLELARISRLQLETEPADQALAAAVRFLAIAFDPLARAVFCLELARLRRAQQRPDEALALFERAASLFEDDDLPREQVEALIEKGELELALFLPEAAVESFDLASTLLHQGVLDSATILRTLRGSAASLAALGHPAEAREVLAAAEVELKEHLAPADALELQALQASLAGDAGHAGETAGAEIQLERSAGGLLAGVARPATARLVADFLGRAPADPELTLELPEPPAS